MANTSEKIREARLKWLGHVERRTEEDVVMRRFKWVDTEGRPKLRWSDVLKKDMKETTVMIEEAQDRRTWRMEI